MKPADLVEILIEAMPRGLKVNVHFQLGDGIEDVLPGLVSKEVRPDDLKFGEWRLTLFSQPRSMYGNFDGEQVPLGHVTFDLNGPLTPASVEDSILDAGEFSRLVGIYNDSPFSGDAKANTASIS
jgi:hypothetical protein